MVIQRENYKVVVLEPAKSRIAQGLCPVCCKPKVEWKRRQDWTCCSKECTEVHQADYCVYSWSDMRWKVLKRDNFTCAKCGKRDTSYIIADHIVPIALGGPEWELSNIQTLCYECNKVKTAEDATKIAALRRNEKVWRVNRQLTSSSFLSTSELSAKKEAESGAEKG